MRSLCLLVPTLLLAPTAASASQFEVSPVRLDLGPSARTAVLTVTNRGGDVVRLQATAVAWAQDATNDLALTQTHDLTLFPSLLTLQPGESRPIRIGTTRKASAVEQTYRVLVLQLPPLDQSAGTVRILTRMSVPVFLGPLKEAVAARIDPAGTGSAGVSLRNTGNVHFSVRAARLEGRDASGQQVLAQDVAGWYVLAGVSRPLAFAGVSRELCPKLRALTVRVETDRGQFSKELDPASECAR